MPTRLTNISKVWERWSSWTSCSRARLAGVCLLPNEWVLGILEDYSDYLLRTEYCRIGRSTAHEDRIATIELTRQLLALWFIMIAKATLLLFLFSPHFLSVLHHYHMLSILPLCFRLLYCDICRCQCNSRIQKQPCRRWTAPIELGQQSKSLCSGSSLMAASRIRWWSRWRKSRG